LVKSLSMQSGVHTAARSPVRAAVFSCTYTVLVMKLKYFTGTLYNRIAFQSQGGSLPLYEPPFFYLAYCNPISVSRQM
jgi:hypothetical protein